MHQKSIAVVALCVLLAACATGRQHWVRGATGVQQTINDLKACRAGADPSPLEPTAASTLEGEAPCMRAKGYVLSR